MLAAQRAVRLLRSHSITFLLSMLFFVEMLLLGAETRRQTKTVPGKTVQGAYSSLPVSDTGFHRGAPLRKEKVGRGKKV